MTEPRRFPFGGVPVYNPQSLSKGEALAQFHARQAAYQGLMDLLRQERPSHVLIIGTRGMGKTTLLQRLRYGVEDDPQLNGRYLVVSFPEEQYNVNRLHHFLLNTAEALADALERLRNETMFKRAYRFAKMAGKLSHEEIEQQVPRFLAEVGQEIRRNLLLLVDNADRLFDTIEGREQWRLRELLSSRRDLTLFGATTQASDGIYGSDRAFFEFFQIHRLAPLMFVEMRDLLLRLSESVDEKEGQKGAAKGRVEEWLAADAARLRTLVQLTGGNPRTTVLLFHLVLDGLSGGAREYLEQLLDQCTPSYKGRVDELPAQAQQVLDSVALRWDPVTAMEVGEDTGLETNTVSTQLTRMVRQGLLEKADPGDSKKALYQVAERFFNIWYLMRASRRIREKLRWFVEFLRVFFESSELEHMAWEQMERFRGGRGRSAEFETAFAYVLASGAGRNRFEDYLRRECPDTEPEWGRYLDFLPNTEDNDPVGRGIRIVPKTTGRETDTSTLDEAETLQKAVVTDPDNAGNWRRLGHALTKKQGFTTEAEAALRKAIELDPKSAWSWAKLGYLLVALPERHEDAEAALRKTIELDPKSVSSWNNLGYLLAQVPGRSSEAEAALRKAIEVDPKSAWTWNKIGLLLRRTPERWDDAETALLRATELDSKEAVYWSNLADLLLRLPGRSERAEVALRKAIHLDPRSAWSWNRLGEVLSEIPEKCSEAEGAYRKAIELNPSSAKYWADLGDVLEAMPERREEAAAALQKAIEIDPKYAWSWAKLGNLLGRTPDRLEEAVAALRKAVEIDPMYGWAWARLGSLLGRKPDRLEEAETALRKAIELDPKLAWHWNRLGDVVSETPARLNEAEAAYRKAVELSPESARYWGELGNTLAMMPNREEEAETALRRAIEIDPGYAWAWSELGNLVGRINERSEEAEADLRKAIDLDPRDAWTWAKLGALLMRIPERSEEAPAAFDKALEIDPLTYWDELVDLCQNDPAFGKVLIGICALVQHRDSSNGLALLHRAVALAQLGDFPRASVALEDALTGDPIDLLSVGRRALEVFFAAAVRNDQVRDCLKVLDRKEWKDAWRPIYEALRAVEQGSGEYLKRVAVEIREPALVFLRRIAPELPGVPARTS